MIQTQWVVARLQQQWPSLDITIEQIHTTGDNNTHMPLTKIGGDGVFVMEIERALSEKRIDLAVHSLKDLPTVQPQGLRVVAAGTREDVRDVLVWHPSYVGTIPGDHTQARLRIGTCSLRRTAQIRALFPAADILSLRGNVDTRLRKLDAGDYDAIVLAAAGLHRLHIQDRLVERVTYLPVETLMPAPGQGALALEIRDEPEMQALIAPLIDLETRATTTAERMFMRRLGAGCYLPIATYGEIVDGQLTLQGLVTSLDGQSQVRVQQSIPWTAETSIESAEQLGIQLAEQALAQGAAGIIETLNDTRLQERQHV
jgi:hydroxymethylbilane synthase